MREKDHVYSMDKDTWLRRVWNYKSIGQRVRRQPSRHQKEDFEVGTGIKMPNP